MPEGDTVYRTAKRLDRELSGQGSLNLNNVSSGDKTSSGRFLYLGY